MDEEYIELDINEYGGCTLRMKREFRKGRGKPSQFRKHTQEFYLYGSGLRIALKILEARAKLGPQFNLPKMKNMDAEKLEQLISSLRNEIANDPH